MTETRPISFQAQLIVPGNSGENWLIVNGDVNNTIYIGDDSGVSAGNDGVPLPPGGSIVIDGDRAEDVWAVTGASGVVVQSYLIQGATQYFQPISALILQGLNPGVFLYSPSVGAGNLIGSFTGSSGTDQYGNTYPGGFFFEATATQTSTFEITDINGNPLVTMDSSGNVTAEGTINANTDLDIAGVSLLSTILPTYAQGFVNRGWVNMGGASWPTTAIGSTETALFEVDVTVPAGRSYMIMLGAFRISCSLTTGTFSLFVRYTTDGSTPTTSTTAIFFNAVVPAASAVMTPEWVGFYNNTGTSPITLSMLVSCQVSTGTVQFHPVSGAVNTLGIDCLDVGDVSAAQAGNNATQFNSGGGSGAPSKQNYTTSWNAANTWCYAGSNSAFSPLGLLNHNGNAVQGDDELGDNGNCATMITWPSAVASALSGATVNSVLLTLNNNHSWYNSGMNYNVGVTTASVTGQATRPGITSPNLTQPFTAEGATKQWNIGAASPAFAAALVAGNAFALFNPSSSRNSYGYAAGAGQSGPPKITVSYTK
jgi:hypothetical protein